MTQLASSRERRNFKKFIIPQRQARQRFSRKEKLKVEHEEFSFFWSLGSQDEGERAKKDEKSSESIITSDTL